LVPSDRVIVPRSLAVAPPAAVTVPVAVTGGHAPAHAPEQADIPLPSLPHRYTALPPSVRNVLPDDEAVVITVEPDPLALAAGAAALGLAPPAAELLLPLLHAAASNAAPSAPPTPTASRAGARIRFTLEFLICVSCHRRPGCARLSTADKSNYGGTRPRRLDPENETRVI
jgi:hypothetical protein